MTDRLPENESTCNVSLLVAFDGPVLRLDLVEGGLEVLLLDAEDGQGNRGFSAPFHEGVDGGLVGGDDGVVAAQVVLDALNPA